MRARFVASSLLAGLIALALALPAVASAVKYPLILEKTGTGLGTVTSSPAGISCGTSCVEDEASFLDGTKVTLTASPKVGSYFEGWSGCDAEPSATKCEITVTEAEPAVEAEFNEIEKFFLTLEKTGTGQGTVTSSPAGISCTAACPEAAAEYLEGTKVTLTASPAAGSFFEGWSGCDAEPSATKCEITVVEETTVAAEFNEIEKAPLTLEKTGTGEGTVTSSPAGISCAAACPEAAAEYLEGTKVTLTASASAGSVFEGWSGCDAEPSATKCEVTVVVWPTIQAEFSKIQKFKLTVIKSGAGRVESTSPASPKIICGSECEKEFEEGTKVTLSKTADPGFEFKEWTGACSGSGACEVTMSAAKSVGAKFDTQSGGGGGGSGGGSGGSGGGSGGGGGGSSSSGGDSGGGGSGAVPGIAAAAATAQVSGGKAALELICSGGACQGTLKLTAKIKQGKKTKNLVIGKASFSLAAASSTLKVQLSGAAKQELAKGKTLKAQLSGTGIAASTVEIRPAKRKPRPTTPFASII